MIENTVEKIELFNTRLDALYRQVCGWLDEESIAFTSSESLITLDDGPTGAYETKRLDIFIQNNERLFSIIPYGIMIIGAEGRVELSGESGEESLVYIHEEEPSAITEKSASEKEKLFGRLFKNSREEGWHWVDDKIIGKKPLLTKNVFLALLEIIN